MSPSRRTEALLDSLQSEWADLSDDEIVARLRQRNATPDEVAEILECMREDRR